MRGQSRGTLRALAGICRCHLRFFFLVSDGNDWNISFLKHSRNSRFCRGIIFCFRARCSSEFTRAGSNLRNLLVICFLDPLSIGMRGQGVWGWGDSGIGSAGMYVMKWLGFISIFPIIVTSMTALQEHCRLHELQRLPCSLLKLYSASWSVQQDKLTKHDVHLALGFLLILADFN